MFEIPADARGLIVPVPLKAMGRFEHETAPVDPKTGIVYITCMITEPWATVRRKWGAVGAAVPHTDRPWGTST